MLVAILSLALTGCGNSNSNISDKDYNIIADYMASLILKYDRSYEESLVDITAKAASHETDINKEVISPNLENTSQMIDQGEEKENLDSSKVIDKNTKNVKLSKLMGCDDFDITYANYKLYQSFPDKKDKNYFTIEAGKNKKLCAVKFSIKNNSTKDKRFNLLNKKMNYELVADSSSYKPLMTLLVNDLQFIDTSIKGGKSKTGYLIFEIPKNIKLENGELAVSRDSTESLIKLK